MEKLTVTFKTIYQRQPFLLILFISILLTIPWITNSEFYTKGEPREATVASYMLNTGNWILPSDYADEIAYKPPFMHWFIAVFSLPAGKVTEITARLPSALGLIGIALMFFAFLYKRKSRFQSVIAALIMLTSFEMHRSGIEARVDMFLAFFMIGALFSLFKWEEKGLKGYPLLIPVFLAGASLVKGPVGILLPCLVFGIYLLMLNRYSLWKIIVKNVIIALPAFAVLIGWYVLAYQQGGTHFLNLVYAENFGRFLGQSSQDLGLTYSLGHEEPFWYYLPAIVIGFLPWSFLLIFSAFGISYKGLFKNVKFKTSGFFKKLKDADKVTLFSSVSVIVILLFYTIPASKRSVYIMPAYPFAAYLLTLLFEWALNKKPQYIKLLSRILLILSGIILLLVFIFHFINLDSIAGRFTHQDQTLHDIGLFSLAFQHPSFLDVVVWMGLLTAFITCLIFLKKKSAKTILFGTLTLYIFFNVFLEGFAYPVYKNAYSSRPFAERIDQFYDLKDNTYVLNDLRYYPNLYGLNFYLGNDFKNFETELPSHGYFIVGSRNIDEIREKYAGKYTFRELDRTPDKYNDFKDVIILYKIIKL